MRARFVAELVNRHARLVVLRAWLDDASAYGPALTETGQICHKIAGTAATLGFPTLGTQAGAIDDLITKSQQATETAAPDLTEFAHEAIAIQLAAGLPMGLAKPCQHIVHQDGAQEQPGSGADPDDQMHDGHVAGMGGAQLSVVAGNH
nr:Hpt domain-containing protein [Paracoccus thiocyanatus]